MRLDVFSDVVCPWCYLGAARLRSALLRTGSEDVELRWRAFQLDPSAGAPRPLRPVLEARYGPGAFDAMTRRLVELGAAEGIEYRFDGAMALDTADAHRLVAAAHERDEGDATALVFRLFEAYFTENLDVSDHRVLAELAPAGGLGRDDAAGLLASDAFADRVAQDRAEATSLDIAGVPTFVVDGRFPLPGAQDVDRLVTLVERHRARGATRN